MVNIFDVASAGNDEQRLVKQTAADKLDEAVYDVRTKFGAYLFQAADLDGFNDRAKIAYVDICQAIEPHMHARKGVHRRVMKTLEREWRQRRAEDVHGGVGGEPGFADSQVGHAGGPSGVASGPGPQGNLDALLGTGAGKLVSQGRLACYPGCDENEEHANKFHQDKEDKEARRKHAEFEDDQNRPELVVEETYESHTSEPLKPEGDFDAYKDSVDQGAESKVDHDFVDGGGEVRQHDENGDHNFVPTVTGSRFPEYQRIARMLLADGDPTATAPLPGAATPSASPPGFGGLATPPADTSATMAGSGTPVISPVTASREYQAIARILQADVPGLPVPAPESGGAGLGTGNTVPFSNVGPQIQTPGGGGVSGIIGSPTQSVVSPMDKAGSHKGHRWASKAVIQDGTKGARLRLVAVCADQGVLDAKVSRAITALIKVGDRNYLQQADEAITKVLNEKAEEFQNTIAPLQQALQTIQQAEQLANPLNVNPPAGTINVMPQQQDPAAGQPLQPAADPAALAQQQQQQPQQLQAARRSPAKRGGSSKKA